MTSIAKTARVALAVAVVALATAGAASADVQRPATHVNPAGSSWSSTGSSHSTRVGPSYICWGRCFI